MVLVVGAVSACGQPRSFDPRLGVRRAQRIGGEVAGRSKWNPGGVAEEESITTAQMGSNRILLIYGGDRRLEQASSDYHRPSRSTSSPIEGSKQRLESSGIQLGQFVFQPFVEGAHLLNEGFVLIVIFEFLR